MAIRFLIHTIVSKRDSSGNCYHYDIVTSTKTGKRLIVNAGTGSDGGNTKIRVRECSDDWNQLYYTEEVKNIRDFDKIVNSFGFKNTVHEHEVTKDMILALEVE